MLAIEDIRSAIAEANEAGGTLELRGAGTKASIGGPGRPNAILDLSGLAGIIDYDPPELVLTAWANTPMAEIDTALAAHGQMLAFEPMDHGPLLGGPAGRTTLAGVLASGASGPRRLTAGAPRDHLLGFEAVSGRGEVFKAGGKVVKNVTGYDIAKLMAGSWGTLAALTQVTVRVVPAPRASATRVLHGQTAEAAAHAMNEALGRPAPPTAAAWLPAGVADRLLGAPGAVTLLRYEGVAAAIPKDGDLFNAEVTTGLWRAIRDVAPFTGDARAVWRISVPPMDGWRVIEALKPLGGEALQDWAGGLIWLALDEPHAVEARAAIAPFGGHATLIRGEGPTFHPEPPALAALTARVKAAFDPRGVLNPRHRLGQA